MLELNDRVRYWFGIEDELNENLAEDNSLTRPEIDNQDLVAIGHVLKRSAQSIKTEINLLN
jgi:heme oxygenase